MLTLAWLLAWYVGYCDANVARQPNQVMGCWANIFSQLWLIWSPTLSFNWAVALAQTPSSNSMLKYPSLCSWESLHTHVLLTLLPMRLTQANAPRSACSSCPRLLYYISKSIHDSLWDLARSREMLTAPDGSRQGLLGRRGFGVKQRI